MRNSLHAISARRSQLERALFPQPSTGSRRSRLFSRVRHLRSGPARRCKLFGDLRFWQADGMGMGLHKVTWQLGYLQGFRPLVSPIYLVAAALGVSPGG
jgi:hypothetical protein